MKRNHSATPSIVGGEGIGKDIRDGIGMLGMASWSSSATEPLYDKKDFKVEQVGIRPFSLMFDDDETEKQWNLTNIHRHIGLTSRYLFVAACFQGIFYWGDYIEWSAGVHAKSSIDSVSNIAFIGLIRLILGVFTLCGCFLVATGMLVPTQSIIWWMNICYGIPTLSLFYFARAVPSHWDCLFLIYGLAFFMLPKISPLNFIFGIIGATVMCVIFIYISSFRLTLQQWMLSTCILLMITSLFSYMCYCSEKLSREKWLLLERLRREKINFRVVSSLSFTDDFSRAVSEEDPFRVSKVLSSHGQGSGSQQHGSVLSFLTDAMIGLSHNKKGTHTSPRSPSVASASGGDASDSALCCSSNCAPVIQSANASADADANNSLSDDESAEEEQAKKEMRMMKFYRGIFAWALCYSMAYAFDMEEVNNSPAFALLMHTMGFSIFLVVVTEQIRWLVLNGMVGLTMLWAFNQAGIEQRWVVFSTHSIGYVILICVIVMMILVFGGVVFVWSHLLDFVKDILIKYPQVKNDLSEDKVVENLIVTYLSDLPKSALLATGGTGSVLEIYREGFSDVEGGSGAHANDTLHSNTKSKASISGSISSSAPFVVEASGSNKATKLKQKQLKQSNAAFSIASATNAIANATNAIGGTTASASASAEDSLLAGRTIISGRRPNCCYFCYSPQPSVLVPACSGWDNRHASSSTSSSTGIPMCSPYTEVVKTRDEALRKIEELLTEQERQRQEYEGKLSALACSMRDQLLMEKRRHDEEMQGVITQQNRQLAELKRLYKAYKIQYVASQKASYSSISAVEVDDNDEGSQQQPANITPAATTSSSSAAAATTSKKQAAPKVELRKQSIQTSPAITATAAKSSHAVSVESAATSSIKSIPKGSGPATDPAKAIPHSNSGNAATIGENLAKRSAAKSATSSSISSKTSHSLHSESHSSRSSVPPTSSRPAHERTSIGEDMPNNANNNSAFALLGDIASTISVEHSVDITGNAAVAMFGCPTVVMNQQFDSINEFIPKDKGTNSIEHLEHIDHSDVAAVATALSNMPFEQHLLDALESILSGVDDDCLDN